MFLLHLEKGGGEEFPVRLSLILTRDFGPGISQRDGSVEYQGPVRRINRIRAEIAHPLKLELTSRCCTCQTWLDLA
jgi:hypothetical protein